MLYKNKKGALIGLIILFAVSIVMAGGRKPKVEPVNVQIRIKSEPEQKAINERYRSSIDLSKYKGKEWYNFRLFVESPKKWGEVEGVTLFKELFPRVVFYKGIVFASWPPGLFAMAEYNGKFYRLPSEFNRLLIDNGLEIDERNIIDFAKAFVIAALIEKRVKSSKERKGIDSELVSFPQITFLEGKRIREYDDYWGTMMDAEIKVRIGTGEVQTWRFSQTLYTVKNRKGEWTKLGQFIGASVLINGKPLRSYDIKFIEKEQRKGELDENPMIKIITTVGNATVEQDSFYYLITYSNGQATNYTVRCSLYNFNPNETVYIRVKPISPYTYGPNDTLGPIIIGANNRAFYDWTPGAEIQTGISKVVAGNMPPGDTFRARTTEKWLTLEKGITGRFHNAYPDTFTVYYTDQFFQGLNRGPNYPVTFAGCVKTAAIESWQKQVIAYFSKVLIEDGLNFNPLLITISEDGIL